MRRRFASWIITLASTIGVIALASCVGDDPGEKNSTGDAGPAVGADTSTSAADSSVAVDSGSGSDTGTPIEAGVPFVCPTSNLLYCETWDDDPLGDGWTKEEQGGLVGIVPSTRYAGRALKLTLASAGGAPVNPPKARFLRDSKIDSLAAITMRFDARVITRNSSPDGQTPPLQLGAMVFSPFGQVGGVVVTANYSNGKVQLRWVSDLSAGIYVSSDEQAPFTVGEWHTMTIRVHRTAPQQVSFQVDGTSSKQYTNIDGNLGNGVRVFAGIKSEPNTGVTEVEHDNVVLLSE